jgi:hypothetical protein
MRMGHEHDQLDLEIKRLERDKKATEIEQLKKTKWVTPTFLLALLPLIGGFGLWVASEVKQFNEAYRAKDELQDVKRRLQEINAEIQTMLLLKNEVRDQLKVAQEQLKTTQQQVDRAYLKIKFTSGEVRYALGHLPTLDRRPDRARLESLGRALDQLPKETADPIREIIRVHNVVMDIAKFSEALTKAANDEVQFIPASDWTRKFQAMPGGSILPNRKLMVMHGEKGPMYYDVDRDQQLSAEDVEAARHRPR